MDKDRHRPSTTAELEEKACRILQEKYTITDKTPETMITKYIRRRKT
jgi:hypothetical protein